MKKQYSNEILSRAISKDAQRIKSMLIELAVKTQYLTKKDIGNWRQAWQMAINVEHPMRANLYDIYSDVLIDLHLTGCIGQRHNMVMKRAFKCTNNNGEENYDITKIFMSEWFNDFTKHVLDSRMWGHSLIQLGDVVTVNGVKKFENVELVPRKHVIPEYGVLVKNVGDEPKKGISYRSGTIANWCIEAGYSHDLGLLLKCAPQSLSKKNMLAFWDVFGEIFGMPIRIGKTTSRDQKEISKVEKMLDEMGAAAWGLFPEGTEVEIKETTRGDAFNVYDKRIERANTEISKGVLNQTMTIDDGASHSQGTVHLEVFENVVQNDARFLHSVVNNKLLPIMATHGFPVEGYSWEWDTTTTYTPSEQKAIEELILTHYDVDPIYFSEKYNIPITGKKENPFNFFD